MKLEIEGIELEYGGRLVYRYRMEFGVVSNSAMPYLAYL